MYGEYFPQPFAQVSNLFWLVLSLIHISAAVRLPNQMGMWGVNALLDHDRLRDFISLAREAFESIATYAGLSTTIPLSRDAALWALRRAMKLHLKNVWRYTTIFNARTFEHVGLLVDTGSYGRIFGRTADAVLYNQTTTWKLLGDSWVGYQMCYHWLVFLSMMMANPSQGQR